MVQPLGGAPGYGKVCFRHNSTELRPFQGDCELTVEEESLGPLSPQPGHSCVFCQCLLWVEAAVKVAFRIRPFTAALAVAYAGNPSPASHQEFDPMLMIEPRPASLTKQKMRCTF